MLLVIAEKQFFTTDISRSVRARYRKPSELFSQESTEADVAKLHHLPPSSPFLEADSYLRGIIIPTISLSDRGRPPRRAARTYFSDLRRYHGGALIPPPPCSSLLDETYAHMEFGICASCTSLGNHVKLFETFSRIELFVRCRGLINCNPNFF